MPTRLQNISVVILAGGQGTRIQAAYPGLPKILIPISGLTILARQLGYLDQFGFKQIILSLGYEAEQVQQKLNSMRLETPLQSIVEEKPLGTGGGLRLATGELQDVNLVVLNGDSIPELNYQDLFDHHIRSKADLTLVSRYCENAAEFGRLIIDVNGRITAFNEKSINGPGQINAGCYILNTSMITAVPEGRFLSLEFDLFPLWIQQGFRLINYDFNGTCYDFGTLERIRYYSGLLDHGDRT